MGLSPARGAWRPRGGVRKQIEWSEERAVRPQLGRLLLEVRRVVATWDLGRRRDDPWVRMLALPLHQLGALEVCLRSTGVNVLHF